MGLRGRCEVTRKAILRLDAGVDKDQASVFKNSKGEILLTRSTLA